jgi:predicted oxidoreductase
MNQVNLAQSALHSSRLAYGCWRLAGPEGITAPVDPLTNGKRAVHAAADAGFTLFDLADIYGGGRCEEIFGAALKESPGLRDRIVVASKCGIRMAGPPPSGAPYRYDFRARYIVESVEGSLRRMGIDALDLLMLHRPDYLMDPAEVAGAFLQLRDAGKVREFGVSNFRPSQLTALQRACPLPLVVHQVEISLAQMAALEDGTLDQCLTERITPMAWSPLARGLLASSEPFDLSQPDHARHERLREALDGLARIHATTRGVIALAWLLKHPAGIVPVIGTTTPERIREAAGAEAVPLDREEWYALLTAARGARLP